MDTSPYLTDEYKDWFEKDSPTDIPAKGRHTEKRISFGISHYPRMLSIDAAEEIMAKVVVKSIIENVEALIKRRKENDDII